MRIAMRQFLILAFMATGIVAISAQSDQNCPARRSVSVTGSATVTVDADLAIVHVGYKLYAPDAKSAYASATQASNAIMTALTGLHIPKSAIESSAQSLQPTQPYELQQYPANSMERHQREFTVSQSWTVEVAPEQAAHALDAAITAGANDSGWIEWTLKDPAALQSEAVAQAVRNAHATAEKIAVTAGVQLGKLFSASTDQPSPRPMMRTEALAMGAQAKGAELAVNARKVHVTASVAAVFDIQ